MVPGPGEDEGGNGGGARVRMRDFATAREAAKECVKISEFIRSTKFSSPGLSCVSKGVWYSPESEISFFF